MQSILKIVYITLLKQNVTQAHPATQHKLNNPQPDCDIFQLLWDWDVFDQWTDGSHTRTEEARPFPWELNISWASFLYFFFRHIRSSLISWPFNCSLARKEKDLKECLNFYLGGRVGGGSHRMEANGHYCCLESALSLSQLPFSLHRQLWIVPHCASIRKIRVIRKQLPTSTKAPANSFFLGH